MEKKKKEGLLSLLTKFQSKNRSSLSVEETKEIEEMVSELKDTSHSKNQNESKKGVLGVIKRLLGFFLKQELYDEMKDFLDSDE